MEPTDSPGQTQQQAHKDNHNASLYKTELCRSFSETGACRYGAKCQFAHGLADLRPVARHRKYKTEKCQNFATNGVCPYGPRCRFIHNTESPAGSTPFLSPFLGPQMSPLSLSSASPSVAALLPPPLALQPTVNSNLTPAPVVSQSLPPPAAAFDGGNSNNTNSISFNMNLKHNNNLLASSVSSDHSTDMDSWPNEVEADEWGPTPLDLASIAGVRNPTGIAALACVAPTTGKMAHSPDVLALLSSSYPSSSPMHIPKLPHVKHRLHSLSIGGASSPSPSPPPMYSNELLSSSAPLELSPMVIPKLRHVKQRLHSLSISSPSPSPPSMYSSNELLSSSAPLELSPFMLPSPLTRANQTTAVAFPTNSPVLGSSVPFSDTEGGSMLDDDAAKRRKRLPVFQGLCDKPGMGIPKA